MKRSIIMVMGGRASHDMSSNKNYKKQAKYYKKIFVETESMKNELQAAGFENVDVYPNGRFTPKVPLNIHRKSKGLRCVFFSKIQSEKGVDLILNTAEALPDVEFVFYGRLDDSYAEVFMKTVSRLQNVTYRGIFKGSSEEVYAELSQFDILLFPTKWDTEGVPGILVEGKIAGLAEIVSNKSYNAELVSDGTEGIVLKENTSDQLYVSIKKLKENAEILNKLKAGSKLSAERYYIENYVDIITNEIKAR